MNTLIVTAEHADEVNSLLESGADEVLVALKGFCFTALNQCQLEDIEENKHISFLMNRLFFPNEIEQVREILQKLKQRTFAYLYFADPAIALIAEELNMTSKLIYRPETLMTDATDATFWMGCGLKSICISPLLTKQEVIHMMNDCKDAEVMIHGHFMMSVSKRPLLTAFSNYSGLNEDLQNDRTLSLVESTRDAHMPIFEDEFGTYIYTDYVLESFEILKELPSDQSHRFLISGVYLTFEEIIDALSCYRRILNGEEGKEIRKEYESRWHSPLSTGYYGQKTVK